MMNAGGAAVNDDDGVRLSMIMAGADVDDESGRCVR